MNRKIFNSESLIAAKKALDARTFPQESYLDDLTKKMADAILISKDSRTKALCEKQATKEKETLAKR